MYNPAPTAGPSIKSGQIHVLNASESGAPAAIASASYARNVRSAPAITVFSAFEILSQKV